MLISECESVENNICNTRHNSNDNNDTEQTTKASAFLGNLIQSLIEDGLLILSWADLHQSQICLLIERNQRLLVDTSLKRTIVKPQEKHQIRNYVCIVQIVYIVYLLNLSLYCFALFNLLHFLPPILPPFQQVSVNMLTFELFWWTFLFSSSLAHI